MQELIRAIQQYVSLNSGDIVLIEKLVSIRQLKKDEFLLKEGTICNDFAFISRGLLRHYVNNDAEEQTYFFSAENSFVCDYESFINRSPSVKNIVAMEDTILFSFSYNDMQAFYTGISTGERFGRLFLESIFRDVISHIISSYTDSARQRYLRFLSLYKHIEQRIPQYYIASFVGVTPQSLSRIRRDIAKK